MRLDEIKLKTDERAILALRALYGGYGYTQYKMSKFEEYDLYVRNKNFLISDNIITFTDTNGKLMALKPDVTLSIIKNSKDEAGKLDKVYYNENVYRVSGATNSFKEIMQVGLECIGDIDEYCIYEVLMLAARSLKTISDDCELDISHLGIVSEVLDNIGLFGEARSQVLRLIGDKNTHDIKKVCLENGVDEQGAELLQSLVSIYGKPSDVIPKLKATYKGVVAEESISTLESIVSLLDKNGLGNMLRIDFSVVSDLSYYNGIVFKGFINGVPTSVLSGGQYDKLLKKMKRTSRAIGFAVYLDMLERLNDSGNEYDVDTVVFYDDSVSLHKISDAVDSVAKMGKSAVAVKSIPENIKYKELIKLS
ncbi:MAG: hypothetical protein E7627_01240 [Ruminococcaceae bacterium]|nr:hypothetical protein [Oscillospiraceae bacterium]